MRAHRLLDRPGPRVALVATALAGLTALPFAGHAATHRGAAAPQPASHPSAAWHARPATYGVVAEKNVPIKMSDGVTLEADIYRPADKNGQPAKGRFPVLLTQTPYNKATGASLAFVSDYLVGRGYVQVVADVRGTGSSQGEWASFAKREQRDGYELVEWAASKKRPWSNGRVGLHGTSYGAINQLLTAAQQPKGLKAAFPIVPMADAYRDVAWSSGQIDTGFIPFWLGLVSATSFAPESISTAPAEAATALADHIKGAVDFQANVLAGGTTGGTQAYDGPFYRERSPIDVINKVKVPTFIVGGEFDLFQRGEPMLYSALRANHVPTRLVLGPWYHVTAGDGLPAQGVPSLQDLELRWDDHYVRGIADRTLNRDIAPVTYYEMGTDKWRTARNWPSAAVHYTAYRLGGHASPGTPGKLGAKSASGSDQLVSIPVTGICTRSTTQWTAGLVAGTPCETNDNLNDSYGLSYDLPVKHTLHVFGPITARLYVSSNRDAEITARVEDVAPDGTATQLTAGWQTLALRALNKHKSMWAQGMVVRPFHPDTKASLLPIKSGQVMRVAVEIFPTATAILPGHTLRLTLQPADEPHLTSTVPQAVGAAGAVLQFWHDAKHPSALILPLRR
jgi:uncharacterized protein